MTNFSSFLHSLPLLLFRSCWKCVDIRKKSQQKLEKIKSSKKIMSIEILAVCAHAHEFVLYGKQA